MKRKKLFGALGIICFSMMIIALSVGGAFAASGVINLKFANFFPSPAAQSKICEEFISELEARTRGRIKVRYFAGGSLLKPPAMIKGIEKGITDIGLSHIEYTPGRFPVMEAAEQPLGNPTGWVANQLMTDFYYKFKPKEFDKVKVMWFHANSPAMLMTTKPVRKLEDMKGLTIRAPGSTGTVIKALGGTPAPTPMPETYDAIAKNVVQGAFVAGEAAKSWRFGEVVKYITDSWRVGTSYPFYVAMNKKKYKKLPPDIKEIFDTLCGEYRDRFALMWNSIEFGGKTFGKSKGVEYIELSGKETKRWGKAIESVIDDYVRRMVSQGFNESEVRGWLKYLEERRDYLIEKQKALNIKSATGPPELR
ncbi:MAG: TRAP transporter substrate-binding protein [Deltaproteobacteria bacterium]|nr:TRAP transporter substrate-binding protein [Deltaproteobacteria bacterium]